MFTTYNSTSHRMVSNFFSSLQTSLKEVDVRHTSVGNNYSPHTCLPTPLLNMANLMLSTFHPTYIVQFWLQISNKLFPPLLRSQIYLPIPLGTQYSFLPLPIHSQLNHILVPTTLLPYALKVHLPIVVLLHSTKTS